MGKNNYSACSAWIVKSRPNLLKTALNSARAAAGFYNPAGA
jgi:hypothetical protein